MTKEERIEKYLLDKLSVNEKQDFEAIMAENEELREEVDRKRDFILAVETMQLRKSMAKIIKEDTHAQAKHYRLPWKTILSIAASFLILVSAAIFLLIPEKDVKSSLLSDYFYSDPGLPITMSKQANLAFYEGMVDYKSGMYNEALDQWSDLYGQIGADTLHYYQGMAYIELSDYDQAQEQLERIEETSAFSKKANWFLIKIHLETENYPAAKTIFDNVDLSDFAGYEELKRYLSNK